MPQENSKSILKPNTVVDIFDAFKPKSSRRNTITSHPSSANLTSKKSIKEKGLSPKNAFSPINEDKKDPIKRLLNIYQKTSQEKLKMGNILRLAKSKEEIILKKKPSEHPIDKACSFKEIIRPITDINRQKSSTAIPSPLNLWNVPFSSLFDQLSQEGFQATKQLGKGSFAVVKLVTDLRTGETFALKTYEKYKLNDSHKMNNVRREIIILRKMSHENIVKLKYAFEDSRKIHLVLEFVGELSLQSYIKSKPIKKLDEEEAKRLFKQVISAINYCHAKNIVHRDIKLENILLDKNHDVKIIDYGFSIIIPPYKKLNIFCGTPSYMAPEIISRNYTGQGADVWALGILLYVMICGRFPFKAANDDELFRLITKGSFTFPEHVSPQAQNLIRSILRNKPSERLTAPQVFI